MEENIEVRDEAFWEALVLSRISRYFVETKDMPQVEVKDLLQLPSFMHPASTRAAAARLMKQAGPASTGMGVVWRLTRGRLAVHALLATATAALQVIFPLLLQATIELVDNGASSTSCSDANADSACKAPWTINETRRGFVLMVLFFLCGATNIVVGLQLTRLESIIDNIGDSCLSNLVFEKLVMLAPRERRSIESAKINNYMSSDISSCIGYYMTLFTVLLQSAQFGLIFYILYRMLGDAIFNGLIALALGALFLIAPVMIMACRFKKKQAEADKRLSLIKELVTNIKVLKMYAWDMQMVDDAEKIRTKEMHHYWLINLALGIQFTVIFCLAPALIVMTLFAYEAAGNDLDAAIVFPALLLFSQLRSCLQDLPKTISAVVSSRVSINRIEEFLNRQAFESADLGRVGGPDGLVIVGASDGNQEGGLPRPVDLAWSESDAATIHGLSLNIKPGLTLIVGPTGAGKSSVLMAILGEMNLAAGGSSSSSSSSSSSESPPQEEESRAPLEIQQQVGVDLEGGRAYRDKRGRTPFGAPSEFVKLGPLGGVAYCSQQPWIPSATLRDCILFGKEFEKERYDAAVDGACLLPDIKALEAGDMTEIGERGLNLSGGQQQRVAIARALYSGASTFLLDDVLAAVDSRVSEALFDNCIAKLSEQPGVRVILVSHQLQYCPRATEVVVVIDGRVAEHGAYSALANKPGGSLAGMLAEQKDDSSAANAGILSRTSSASMPGAEADLFGLDAVPTPQTERVQSSETELAPRLRRKSSASFRSSSSSIDTMIEEAGVLVKEEERSTGRVSRDVTWWYLKKMLGTSVLLVGFGVVTWLPQIFVSAGNYWLMLWSDDLLEKEPTYYLWGYAYIQLMYGVATLAQMTLFVVGGFRASRLIYKGMVLAVARSPMSFFDTTPTGRILNRFGGDQSAVDNALPMLIKFFLILLLMTIGSGVVSVLAVPWLALSFAPVTFYMLKTVSIYRRVKLNTRRLQRIIESPYHIMLVETSTGISTIRAFARESDSLRVHSLRLEDKLRTAYTSDLIPMWQSLRIGIVKLALVTSTVFFVVLVRAKYLPGDMTGGQAGLAVLMTVIFSKVLQYVFDIYVNIEAVMTCAERVKEFSELPPEAPLRLPESAPDAKTWPSDGIIEVDDVHFRYRDNTPRVLRHLSFSIKRFEKVGVIGRTGSGKSTLLQALFRMNELDKGSIRVDGVDISSIGLHDLRGTISIIPQEPVMFTGSVRKNLDPFNRYSDEDLWRALAFVQMGDAVKAHHAEQSGDDGPLGLNPLEAVVEEGGENWSVGQRQLICMARVLLKRPKILCLDEATASVDVHADARLQKTIREEFADCTILTIAHRLETIADSDRILSFEDGKIAEFDHPWVLLEKKESLFHKLCHAGSEERASHLKALASGAKASRGL